MVASILERTGAPARAQPRRREHGRRRRHRAGGAARRGGRALDGDLGLFEVDEFWLGPVVEELEPRAVLLGNLFRDQLDRYGELETIADRWAAIVAARRRDGARAQRRRPADRRPRPRRARQPLYFGVDDDALALPELQHASDSKHCRRCGHAYAYEAIYLGHLGHYRCPNCGQRAPGADGPRHRRRAARHPHAPPSRCTRRDAASSSRSPASTTSTTRSAPPRCASALGVAARRRRRRPRSPSRPPSAAPRRSTSAAARPRSCSSRTPPAPTRCCARSRSRAASSTCSACSTTAPPTAATSLGLGRRLGAARRRVRPITCSGTRAAELALRLKYAGVDPERIHVVDDLEAGARRRAGGRRRAALRRAHLHRAARAARAAGPPRPGAGVLAMSTRDVVWHDLECGGYDADLPLWRELAREAAGGVLDVGAGTGRVALDLAAAGHDVTALDLDPALLDVLARARGRGRRATSRPSSPTRRLRRSPTPRRRSSSCRCRRSSCSPEPRAGFFACARRALEPGRPRRAGDRHRRSSPSTAHAAAAAARRGRGRRLDATSPSRSRSASTGGDVRDRAHPRARRPRRRARRPSDDVIELARRHPRRPRRGGRRRTACEAEELRHIPETPDHVGSEVVMLRG